MTNMSVSVPNMSSFQPTTTKIWKPLAWTDDKILEKIYVTHVLTAEKHDVESLFNVTSNIIRRSVAVADTVTAKVRT